MSEEALQVLRMVQEGKLTPEQGVEFLKAIKDDGVKQPKDNQDSHDDAHWSWRWGSIDQAQSTMASVQEKLAEVQAKLSAAKAQENCGTGKGNWRRDAKFPFGGFNVSQVIDDALKGFGNLQREATIGAKSAMREAGREARRVHRSTIRAGRGIHTDVFVNVNLDPFEATGDPDVSKTTIQEFELGESSVLSIRNDFGNVAVYGTSADSKVHVSVNSRVWIADKEKVGDETEFVEIKEDRNANGDISLSIVSKQPQDAWKVRSDVRLDVPANTIAEINTLTGNILAEDIGSDEVAGYVKSAKTNTGDIKVSRVKGQAHGPTTLLESHSGNVTAIQWTGADLKALSHSGDVTNDLVKGGDFDLRSRSGNVQAQSVTASMRFVAESVSGNVELSDLGVGKDIFSKSMSGNVDIENSTADEISAESASGEITVEKCRVTGKALVAKSISGDVKVSNSNAQETIANTTSGNCKVQLAQPSATNAASVSGDVTVTLPADASFETSLTTVSGDIKCGFQLSSLSGDSKRYLGGMAGCAEADSPRPKIALQSVSGDIKIKPVS